MAAFVGDRTDFRDETIYFVITTRFYDGDKSNNTYCWDGAKDAAKKDPNWRGDFKGLIEKLDYIKALGFTAGLLPSCKMALALTTMATTLWTSAVSTSATRATTAASRTSSMLLTIAA